ncbi:slipin family protein [Patescibacteria group bacterium]|nr:slipin family protein [Patescibacteria group bacterium]MBU4057215.1 slipin family protein [Patescibacteria group bacterium]MBU4368669.1 slipin family protein [Patescibacteria group bacterium]
MIDFLFTPFGFIVVLIAFAASAIKIAQEYERGVIFRLGRLVKTRGPGLFLVIPLIEKMVKVDLRIITLDVPAQDVITRDNIPVKIDAVLYFKVSDPAKAITEVEHFITATSQIAQTSLRGVAGEAAFDEILAEREKINAKLHKIIDEATDPWGVKVTMVEIKHVETPEAMQRAIAKQAEAERMRRAKVILAEGEYQAAQKLKEAGDILGADPITLRYLETLAEAAKEPNTTILFPVEMLGLIKKLGNKE